MLIPLTHLHVLSIAVASAPFELLLPLAARLTQLELLGSEGHGWNQTLDVHPPYSAQEGPVWVKRDIKFLAAFTRLTHLGFDPRQLPLPSAVHISTIISAFSKALLTLPVLSHFRAHADLQTPVFASFPHLQLWRQSIYFHKPPFDHLS